MREKRTPVEVTTMPGIAQYPYLNKPDDAFGGEGKYKVSLILDDADTEIIRTIDRLAAEWHPGKKKVKLPYVQDEETGKMMLKNIWSYYTPTFMDAVKTQLNPASIPSIGAGSILVVQAEVAFMAMPVPGVRLVLKAVQIIKPKFTSTFDTSNFEVVEGGYISEEDDAQKDTTPSEITPKNAANF